MVEFGLCSLWTGFWTLALATLPSVKINVCRILAIQRATRLPQVCYVFNMWWKARWSHNCFCIFPFWVGCAPPESAHLGQLGTPGPVGSTPPFFLFFWGRPFSLWFACSSLCGAHLFDDASTRYEEAVGEFRFLAECMAVRCKVDMENPQDQYRLWYLQVPLL